MHKSSYAQSKKNSNVQSSRIYVKQKAIKESENKFSTIEKFESVHVFPEFQLELQIFFTNVLPMKTGYKCISGLPLVISD